MRDYENTSTKIPGSPYYEGTVTRYAIHTCNVIEQKTIEDGEEFIDLITDSTEDTGYIIDIRDTDGEKTVIALLKQMGYLENVLFMHIDVTSDGYGTINVDDHKTGAALLELRSVE